MKVNINTFLSQGLDPTKLGEQRIKCPNCIARNVSNPSDKCLSVNLGKQTFQCFKCGDLYKGFVEIENLASSKPYIELKPIDQYDISEKAIEWFKSRKISLNTLKRFRVTADNRSIHFNFFKNDKLINIKKRFPEKQFTLEKDAEITFYNYDQINDDLVVITEGEIDALSVYEALPNVPVISLPNGANSLRFLDAEIDKFDNVSEIVIATDSDEQGLKAKDNLLVRFGTDRTSFVKYPKDCKDFNDVLVKYGVAKVKECFEAREKLPIRAVNIASDFEAEIKEYIINGFPNALVTGTGLDEKIRLMLSEFVILTGTPNSGKSTFLDWLTSFHVKMNSHIRICVLSAENKIPIHITKIARHYLRRDIVGIGVDGINNDVLATLGFINEKYVFINAPEMTELHFKDVIEKMKQVVKRYGCNYFIIDPYNYIERDNNESNSHSIVLRAFANFAKNYNSLVILVAHPRKMTKGNDGINYEVVRPYDISGSADFNNIADTIISFWRDFIKGGNRLYIQKLRNEWNGKSPSEQDFKYISGTYDTIESKTDFTVMLPKDEDVPF